MKEKSILIRDEQHDWLTDDTCYLSLSALVPGHLDELMDELDDDDEDAEKKSDPSMSNPRSSLIEAFTREAMHEVSLA